MMNPERETVKRGRRAAPGSTSNKAASAYGAGATAWATVRF